MDLMTDINEVFFTDFAEPVLLNGKEHLMLIERDLEVLDEEGTADLIEYAVTAKKGVLERGAKPHYMGSRWSVGRLLEPATDGLYETWELSGA